VKSNALCLSLYQCKEWFVSPAPRSGIAPRARPPWCFRRWIRHVGPSFPRYPKRSELGPTRLVAAVVPEHSLVVRSTHTAHLEIYQITAGAFKRFWLVFVRFPENNRVFVPVVTITKD